jgi:hypothetical protein
MSTATHAQTLAVVRDMGNAAKLEVVRAMMWTTPKGSDIEGNLLDLEFTLQRAIEDDAEEGARDMGAFKLAGVRNIGCAA